MELAVARLRDAMELHEVESTVVLKRSAFSATKLILRRLPWHNLISYISRSLTVSRLQIVLLDNLLLIINTRAYIVIIVGVVVKHAPPVSSVKVVKVARVKPPVPLVPQLSRVRASVNWASPERRQLEMCLLRMKRVVVVL